MRVLVIAALLVLSEFTLANEARQSYTTVECAETSGQFSGSAHVKTPARGFNADELKDIVLGTKQVADASMPYPSEVVVGPIAVNLQDVKLNLSPSPFGFSKAVFFVIEAKNFPQLNVFCTITNATGL